jgi:hypothetical protein
MCQSGQVEHRPPAAQSFAAMRETVARPSGFCYPVGAMTDPHRGDA